MRRSLARTALALLGGLLLIEAAHAADGGAPSVAVSPDEAAVLSAVFKRAVADPKTVPDGQVQREGAQVWVREELEERGTRKIPEEVVASLNGWSLRPLDALQHDADATDANVFFLVVDSLTVSGNSATIDWGTDITIPAKLHAAKMCCAIATDEYRKVNGVWVFRKRVRLVVI
jgi:hypothetical protein